MGQKYENPNFRKDLFSGQRYFMPKNGIKRLKISGRKKNEVQIIVNLAAKTKFDES